MNIKLITTTTDRLSIAQNISRELIKKKITPCVQIIPNISSTYFWNGEIIESNEYLLFIKTSKYNVDSCKLIVERFHNYEVPEIIETDAIIVNNNYSEWFKNSIENI